MFASRLLVKERSRARQLTVLVSVGAHAALALGLWTYSFWKINKLQPKEDILVLRATGLPRLGDNQPAGAPTPAAPKIRKKVLPPDQLRQPDQTPKAAADPGAGEPSQGPAGPGPGGGLGPGRPDGDPNAPEHCEDCIPGIPNNIPTVDAVPDAPEQRVDVIPQDRIEGQRIAGEEKIQLPDAMLARVASEGKTSLTVGARVCVDERGGISAVTISKSSGFDDVDAHVARGVRAWRFEPWRVAGEAVPVCFATRFQYLIER